MVGTIAAGMLIGILLSRTISGLVADQFGWRAIYVLAAVIAWVLAVILARAIPTLPPRPAMSYPALMRSVFAGGRQPPGGPVTLVLGAATFGTFSLFWTAMTFLLSAPPFGYPVSVIGLFGLAGLAGALAARGAGRLHDRGLSLPATGAALALALASLVLAWLGQTSIVVLLIAILAFDIAAQASLILNQTRLLQHRPRGPQPDEHRLRHRQLHRRRDRFGPGRRAVAGRRLDRRAARRRRGPHHRPGRLGCEPPHPHQRHPQLTVRCRPALAGRAPADPSARAPTGVSR